MKYTLLLILTISLSGSVYAASTSVTKTAAPSADEASSGSVKEQEKIYYDNSQSDTIKSGQSATKRDYQYDSNVNSCRSMNGRWIRTGERGYATCMDSMHTLKK